MTPVVDRRRLIGGVLAASLSPRAMAASRAPLRIALLGQSLIQRDLCRIGWPGMAAIARRLATFDAVFTDLETAIDGPGAGPPTREGQVFHAAGVEVIDCLRTLGVTLVTTANNHAADLGPPGILTAIAELDRRGIAHAGTGADVAHASAATTVRTPHGAVALVAAATGAIRDGAAATATRAGVAELRRLPDGTLDPDDVARTLSAIRTARSSRATVLMCLHNHHWEPDRTQPPAFQRLLARACIDAGAAAFVGHGVPQMQVSEMYRGAPIYHGLGNFIFQTRKTDDAYGDATWRSRIVEARFANGRFLDAVEVPLQLDRRRMPDGEFTWGTPSMVDDRQADGSGASSRPPAPARVATRRSSPTALSQRRDAGIISSSGPE